MKINLEPLNINHAKVSYKWRNDKDIWKYTGSRPDKKITLEIEENWIKSVIKREKEKRFAILADNIYVGNIQVTSITSTDGEFHIFIGEKKYWGKGIAFLAMNEFFKIVKKLKLQKLYLFVNKKNIPAISLYKKQDFIEIEVKEENILMEKLL